MKVINTSEDERMPQGLASELLCHGGRRDHLSVSLSIYDRASEAPRHNRARPTNLRQ